MDHFVGLGLGHLSLAELCRSLQTACLHPTGVELLLSVTRSHKDKNKAGNVPFALKTFITDCISSGPL